MFIIHCEKSSGNFTLKNSKKIRNTLDCRSLKDIFETEREAGVIWQLVGTLNQSFVKILSYRGLSNFRLCDYQIIENHNSVLVLSDHSNQK